jgi:hypothetical protein
MKSTATSIILYSVAAALVPVALTLANYRLAAASPGGVDFMTHWVGTRALFRGESPYSNSVAVRVQTMFYGYPAKPGDNEFLSPYLIYVAIIFAPFALIPDYTLARSVWMTFLEIATLAIFIVPLKIMDWRPRSRVLASLIFFSIFGYHSIRPIINGNVTTVITLLIIIAIWAIQNKRDYLAGVLMALVTAKPNVAILPTILFILWAIGLRRWRFIAWFASSLAVFVTAGMLIIPDWPLQNLANILHYSSYNPPTTIDKALEFWFPGIGRQIGWGVSTIVAIVMLREWFTPLRSDFNRFLWTFSLTLVASQWIGISTDPGNFILLTLPLVLVLRSLDQLPNGSLWVSITLGALFIGLWILFLVTVDRTMGNLQNPIMFFPLPLFLFIGLYFARRQFERVGP